MVFIRRHASVTKAISTLQYGINTNVLLRSPLRSKLVDATCILLDGEVHTHIPCDSLVDGRDCVSRNRVTDGNTCTDFGFHHTPIRNFEHYKVARQYFLDEGLSQYWTTPGAVYNTRTADYRNCLPFASRSGCARDWRSIDGGEWFIKQSYAGEPNGDYDPYCYLSGQMHELGFHMNDRKCLVYSGKRYMCGSAEYKVSWQPSGPASTCLDWYSSGARQSRTYLLTHPVTGKEVSAWCDMMDDALTGVSGGWTLIGITNGGSDTYTMPFVDGAPQDAFSGHYTKDLTGRSFTAQRFECGTSSQGVKGSMVEEGNFVWSGKGQFSASISSTETNAVWKPRLPGDTSGDADKSSNWNNHYGGVHYPNFGITGFPLVDGRQWSNHYCFTCDPQNNAFGEGSTSWFSGASGTRFVRYWLR